MLPWVKKVHPLLSSHIKIHPHIGLELFLLVNCAWSVHISLLIQMRWLLEEVLLWTHFSQKQRFDVKMSLMMDLFLTNMQPFASQDVNWWTGGVWITCGLLLCFNQLFELSFWRHPFTAEDPLVSKSFNAKFIQIGPNEKKLTHRLTHKLAHRSWMAWG